MKPSIQYFIAKNKFYVSFLLLLSGACVLFLHLQMSSVINIMGIGFPFLVLIHVSTRINEINVILSMGQTRKHYLLGLECTAIFYAVLLTVIIMAIQTVTNTTNPMFNYPIGVYFAYVVLIYILSIAFSAFILQHPKLGNFIPYMCTFFYLNMVTENITVTSSLEPTLVWTNYIFVYIVAFLVSQWYICYYIMDYNVK